MFGKQQRLHTFTLNSDPGLQSLLLPTPADSSIEHQQLPIDRAYDMLDFRQGNEHLSAHLYDLDAPSFDPTQHRQRMQAQFVSGGSHTQQFLS
jgi:hypothetical protein